MDKVDSQPSPLPNFTLVLNNKSPFYLLYLGVLVLMGHFKTSMIDNHTS